METIKSPRQFDKEFSQLPEEKIARIEGVLRGFIKDARDLLKTAVPVVDAMCAAREISRRHSCSSCAFAPETDTWPGFKDTIYGVVYAIHYDKFFMCHSGQPDWKGGTLDVSKLIKCMSFLSVLAVHKDKVKFLASKAMEEIQTIALN